MMINRFTTALHKALDASYVTKFIIRLLAFYLVFRSVNWLWVGLITPEGYYSAFIDHYLDYVTIIKESILQTGKLIAAATGVSSRLMDGSILQVENGGELRMAWACCGLEVMSFWAAFALADTTKVKTKLVWCFGGLFCIWLINCIRVAFLVVAKENKWQEVLQLDQHDLFNAIAYALVILLMFIYYKKNQKAFGAQDATATL